jgi:hypothetical protein
MEKSKQKVTCKQALDYLESNELTQKENLRLLGILNKNLNTFPISSVITITQDGGYVANGQKLTVDEVVKFRQGISALRDNWAFQLLGDQILFEAIKHGVHHGDTTEKLMFSKTAIYFVQKFREFITTFDIR